MTRRRRLSLYGLLCIAALVVAACSSITGPNSAPAGPTGPVVDMNGNWTGTLEASNLPTQTITMVVDQLSDNAGRLTSCVDGGYATATNDVNGGISGFAGETSFSGQFSYTRTTAGGGACRAAGTVTGSVDANGIHWTSTDLAAIGTCVGGVPQNVVITLHR